MRVISGTAKGRNLKGPPGLGTRPMTDRLKTSLFNILSPYGLEGIRVLDLYAGSGSLGIELLSRGAEWADFVEQNASVCRIIADNLRTTRLAERARVYNMPVARFLAMRRHATGGSRRPVVEQTSSTIVHPSQAQDPSSVSPEIDPAPPTMPNPRPVDSGAEYDIILLDPPYADPAIPDTLEAVALSPFLAEDGLVVIGHANRVKLLDEYGGGRIRRVRHRAMGDSAFSIYEVAAERE